MSRFACPNCGKYHLTELNVERCREYRNWDKAVANFKKNADFPSFLESGTKEEFYPPEILRDDLFRDVKVNLWSSWLMKEIIRRDERRCQDCGTEEGYFEVHHIIPRSEGGSDHPKNLKTLCRDCHRKYTDELISDLAMERKVLRTTNGIKIDDFECPESGAEGQEKVK